MKRGLVSALAAIAVLTGCATQKAPKKNSKAPKFPGKEWVLEWKDDFNGNEINWNVWEKCQRGKPDWCNTMSDDPSLFQVKNGILTLRGIVNPDTSKDPSPYLTGGIQTKDHKAFAPGGYLEVRAKLQGAQGAWPAIWLLPFDTTQMWPNGGEVDIMERLSFEDKAYQTVHSHYTYDLGRTANPLSTLASPIDPNGYNVYGVAILEDKVEFYINGHKTLTYPKINDGAEGQYPFYKPMYLLIDMQLGGQWVGKVNPDDLPVEMQVDWVKYYRPAKK